MNLGTRTRACATAIIVMAIGATGAFAADKATVETEKPIAATEVPAGSIVVGIDKLKFETPELTVKAGDTVFWVNKEVMPHNVAFKKGIVSEKAVQGATLRKGQAWAATFHEAGVFDYFCTPHPFMRGKIIVE